MDPNISFNLVDSDPEKFWNVPDSGPDSVPFNTTDWPRIATKKSRLKRAANKHHYVFFKTWVFTF